MKMTNARKRNLGILSLLPLISLIITLIYEDSKLDGLFSSGKHHAANSVISVEYNNLVILYGITAILSIILLLYFIVHVARVKHLTSGRKILLIAFLTLLLPLSFPLFWYFEINREPKELPVKEGIS